MSEPQQPPVPPSAQPNPAFPPAPPAHQPPTAQHLPASPQYPAAPQHPATPPQQPPYATPQQYPATPQQPYGQQPYPQATRREPGPGNPLARTAFIIALAVAAVVALQILTQPFVFAAFDYTATGYGALNLVFSVIVFLGSAAALVLGLIAVRRPGGQALAGIAIGVGGIQLIGIVLGWISSLFYGFF